MIKVNFFYPNTGGSTFDMDYYLNVHCPLAREIFGPALKGISIDRCESGIMPGSAPLFHAIGGFIFDSVESFYETLMPRMEEMRADAPKYSDGDAIIQISEIVLDV